MGEAEVRGMIVPRDKDEDGPPGRSGPRPGLSNSAGGFELKLD